MMRVTFITGSFPNMPCGVGDYTAQLVEALLKADPNVYIDIITSAEPKVTFSKLSRFTMHHLQSWGLASLPNLLSLINSCRPDVVHIQYPTKGYGTGLAPNLLPLVVRAWRPGLPLVVTLHEFSVAHPLRRLSMIFFLLYSRRVIACDGREQRALDQFLHLRRQKTVLLPLGANIPVGTFQSIRMENTQELMLCYFGFVDKTKDMPLLLEVLARLRGEGLPVRLLFIGGITPEGKARLQVQAKVMGVSEYLTFTGFCSPEEVSRYLAASHAVLFPFRDGISLRRTTFLAAMQHGLPVVTTRAKDYLPEGLVDGENVLLVDAGDTEGFITAARRLVSDAGLRIRIGTEAARWGASFKWDAIAIKHLSLYKEPVGKAIGKRREN